MKFNKEIEGDNNGLAERQWTFIQTQKRLPKTMDVPDDASFVTIFEEEKVHIVLPSMWPTLKGLLHTLLLRELMDRFPNLGIQKRKSTDAHVSNDLDSDFETRPVKTRQHTLLTPRPEVKCTYGASQQQPIPNALLITMPITAPLLPGSPTAAFRSSTPSPSAASFP